MTSSTSGNLTTGDQRPSVAVYTPGPWRTNIARLSDNSINVSHVCSSEGNAIAQLSTYGDDETIANARLIAAAPDMLAALLAIADADTAPLVLSDAHSLELMDAVRAAIAKATGAT